jgi:YHS domain-containing protein
MKIIIGTSLVMASLLILSCGQTNDKANAASVDTNQVATMDTAAEKTYAVSLVNNKKDPTCGMPVTAGISDTTHYENLVLGFCSTECKNEFLKNPKANLAAAEVK